VISRDGGTVEMGAGADLDTGAVGWGDFGTDTVSVIAVFKEVPVLPGFHHC